MRLLVRAVCSLLLASAGGPLVAQQDPEKEYQERLKKIDGDDIDQLLELAYWCEANSLADKARLTFFRVIRKDPDNEEARLALGHVRSGDQWVTKEEAEKLRRLGKLEPPRSGGLITTAKSEPAASTPAAEAVAALPTEKELRSRVRENSGAFTKVMKQLVRNYVDAIGVNADAFNAGQSDHALILSKSSGQEIENLLTLAEIVYARLNHMIHGTPEANTFRTQGPHVYYLIEDNAFEETLDFIAKEHPQVMTKEGVERFLRLFKGSSGGLSNAMPGPLHVARSADRKDIIEFNRSAVANSMGHHWLTWNARACLTELVLGKKQIPNDPTAFSLTNWLGEGMGIWASMEELGYNLCFRITKTVYAGNTGQASKGQDPSSMYMEICYDVATGRAKNPITFFELSKLGLNQLDDRALAMSWSIVDYMIKERLDQFRSLIQLLNKRPSFRMAFIEVFGDESRREILRKTKEDQQLDELYRLTCHDFEQTWKEWVKGQNEYKDASDPRKRKARPKREFPGDEADDKPSDKGRGGKRGK